MRFTELGTVTDSEQLFSAVSGTIDEMIDGTREDGNERFSVIRLRGCSAQRSNIIIGKKETVDSVYDNDAIMYCHTHPVNKNWEARVPSPIDLTQHLTYKGYDAYGLLAALTPNGSILTHYVPALAAESPDDNSWEAAIKEASEISAPSLSREQANDFEAYDRYCTIMQNRWHWLAKYASHNKGDIITQPHFSSDLVADRGQQDDY